jgi:F0F1-type ATP synthase alpha subunit
VQNRGQARYQLWFPVQLVAGGQEHEGGHVAMVHNSSTSGMLLAVNSAREAIDVGATVELSFQLPESSVHHRLTGRVTRIEPNSCDPEGAWPARIAVAFDEVSPQLAPYLEAAATQLVKG